MFTISSDRYCSNNEFIIESFDVPSLRANLGDLSRNLPCCMKLTVIEPICVSNHATLGPLNNKSAIFKGTGASSSDVPPKEQHRRAPSWKCNWKSTLKSFSTKFYQVSYPSPPPPFSPLKTQFSANQKWQHTAAGRPPFRKKNLSIYSFFCWFFMDFCVLKVVACCCSGLRKTGESVKLSCTIKGRPPLKGKVKLRPLIAWKPTTAATKP